MSTYKATEKCKMATKNVVQYTLFARYCTHQRSPGGVPGAMRYSCAGGGGGAVEGGTGLPSAVCASINSTRVPSGS